MQKIEVVYPTISIPEVLRQCFPLRLTDAICRCGAKRAEELRLHTNRYATVTCDGKNYQTSILLNETEMESILKRMCDNSLYAYAQNIRQGFITLSGGIRVGIGGSAAVENGIIIGISKISSLMVRIPHKITVDCDEILTYFLNNGRKGMLFYAPPGVGKTTLLRTVAEKLSSAKYSCNTVVVDTREEFCDTLQGKDLSLDILKGYPRDIGIEIAVRCFGAQIIICDEIGGEKDAQAVLSAANCGVPLIASTHARTVKELLSRPSISSIHRLRVFENYVGICRHGNGFSYTVTNWEDAERHRQNFASLCFKEDEKC